MRSTSPRYPVDRYLVESSKKFEMVNITDDEIWSPSPTLRPEDEIILRKLHEMLQSTADDLKLLSGELSKFHEPGVQVKSPPTPLDEEFNEKVHIEEVVNAKFHGYKIVQKPLLEPEVKTRNDTIDGVKVNQTKKINTDVKAKAAPVLKRPVINKNLGISRTRIMQINDKSQGSVKIEKLNNGKVIHNVPAVAYNEFSFKYVEPKVTENPQKKLQIQDMPRISIRSELKQQNVLQLDIVPEQKEEKEMTNVRSNVSVVAISHNALPSQSTVKSNKSVNYLPTTSRNKHPIRKISKMSTCESSGSTNNVDSDARAVRDTQKRIISVIRNSPKISTRDRIKTNTTVKKELEKRPRLNVDEWKNKLSIVYGSGKSKKNKLPSKKSPLKKSNVTLKPTQLNNTEYIPYSRLTLGGVSVSDIEREISNIPNNTDIPLSPILDRILSSREHSLHKETPRKHSKKSSPKILTTSDENLLQEVIDIEISVSETLTKNLKKKVNEPVPQSQNISNESNNDVEDNDSYADDFEDEKSDHSGNSGNPLPPNENQAAKQFKNQKDDDSDEDSSRNDDINAPYKSVPSIDRNTTYTKRSNLSLKDSVDIFEFVHLVDTQETATQSNEANKITPKETQTSPRYDRATIQPIHNDLWPSTCPRKDMEKMFQLEKDFIKRLIMDEYGDLLEKNINKPSTSNESKTEDSRKNVAASQKNTQTSPAHVKSVMTSPRKTKSRTTSPFNLSVPVHQQTSPNIFVTNVEEQKSNLGIEADDISVNLSSPRFSLRLPQNSREVISNLEHQSRSHSKVSVKNNKLNNTTFTKTTVSSSSSLDADNSSSEISSLGEIKIKRRLRKRVPSFSEYSTSSTVSKYSIDLHSAGILPLRSEGEASLGQATRKKLQKPIKSDGETSFCLK